MYRNKWGNISRNVFIIGIIIFLISLFIPSESFWKLIGEPGITATGFSLLILMPIMGVIGIIAAIIGKKFIWIIPNALLVFSFFIAMFLGSILLGP